MKRFVSIVMLVIAGVLAFTFLFFWIRAILRVFGSFDMLTGNSRTGIAGVRSVSRGFSDGFLLSVPITFSSFLLWRACAMLSDGSDRTLARHQRFHGVVALAGVLMYASVIGLAFLLLAFEDDERSGPGAGEALLTMSLMMLQPVVAFCLSVSQLYTVVTAFKSLRR
jgi:hypothetical protein